MCVVGKAAGGVASCGQMRARGAEAVVACTRLRARRTFRFGRGKLTLVRKKAAIGCPPQKKFFFAH